MTNRLGACNMFAAVVCNKRNIVSDSHHQENTQSRFADSQVNLNGSAQANDTPTDAAQKRTPQQELLERLGTTLSPDMLVMALTHRSFAHEHEGAPDYERLEFLGDAVLEFVSTETLYRTHPDMKEGELAKMRAMAVSEQSLSQIAREKLQVGPYILLGRGEAESGGAEKNSILCDIVESLIGATFIEHGIDEARKVIHHLIDDELTKVATEGPALDWKTSLTIKAHSMGLEDPHYRMGVSGPEYAQVFTAHAVVGNNNEVLGVGTGSSKRKAQLAAAQAAWNELNEHSERHRATKHRNRKGTAASQQ